MSNYINRYLDSIPLGYTISQMQATIVGNLLACGWQQVATSYGAWTDVIPPATETIGTSNRFSPAFNLPDIFKWSGSEPNETSAWCSVPSRMAASAYTLQTAMDDVSTYSSVALNTTAGLPTAGSVQIGMERFDYTGITAPSITGVTRSAGGTAKERHFVGDAVLPGQWFLKVNTSALACGPLQPA